MRKVWDIHGGIHPAENKTQSNQSPIASIRLPEEFILPLSQHIGAPSKVVIGVGEHVNKGQLLAEANGFVSAAIHAPSSGTITAIEDRPILHSSGMSAPSIVLQADGKDNWTDLHPANDYRSLSSSDLIEKIRQAGIIGMGGAGFPTSVKMQPKASAKIDTLIINGTECEPYITADDMLMREKADEIIAGVEILAHILQQPENVLIGIEDNKPEAITAMQKAAEGKNINIVSFPTKYPSGGEKQLIQILTGREVPSASIPAEIGIVLQNVGTARAVYRAIQLGEPLISRVTTVVGEALGNQQNIDVLIGTPVAHVLEEHAFNEREAARLIIGGPMMGYAMEHSFGPVLKTTNCLLVPSHSEMPAPPPQQPCIRCGMCAEACPASLLPQQLLWFSQSEDFERLQSHNLKDCIECGACSFVCPSNIPLVQYYRASKGAIRIHEDEKRKAEHSRQRFEFRKERLEKAEQEKEAKRLARKQAAEAAKKKLAESKTDSEQTAPAEKKPAKPKAAADSPEKARAKLERAVSSAKSRAERAQKQIVTATEENAEASRVDTLKARLKDAELKLADAQKRLDDFDNDNDNNSNANNDANSPVDSSAQHAAIDKSAARIKEKLDVAPADKINKAITTLEKRIATAKQKWQEAQDSQSPTADALAQGVSKLEAKLLTAQGELAALEATGNVSTASANEKPEPAVKSAADKAIEKAKASAKAAAAMSPEEKAQAQIASLEKRLTKARLRLTKAEQGEDDNIDAFRTGVEKLETKLAAAKGA